jgi:hypothetical protein
MNTFLVKYTTYNHREYKLIVSAASNVEELDAKVADYITSKQGTPPATLNFAMYDSRVHDNFHFYKHVNIT